MAKKINILSLSLTHCATACLLQDGVVTGAVSEERFNRIKNSVGYPRLSIKYLLKLGKIRGRDLDLIVFNGMAPIAMESEKNFKLINKIYLLIAALVYRIRFLDTIYQAIYKIFRPLYTSFWRKSLVLRMEKELNISADRVVFADHHMAHAYASVYSQETVKKDGKYLVLTNDGMGDNYCTAVSIFSKGKFSFIGKKTPNNSSLALVYAAMTLYLGMKPLEHEYKVMGLAPYADEKGQQKSYQILQKLVWLNDDLSFSSLVSAPSYYYWIKDHLEGHRFDWLSGAIQQLTEERLLEWVREAIKLTGIKKLIFGGGIFMNVKANMLISQLPEIKEVHFMPSSTDESSVIGAAYLGYEKVCQQKSITFDPKPLINLYLGPKFNKREVKKSFKKVDCRKKYKVEKLKNPAQKVAQLISQGKVVARFSGRMEWGARALGNRSILADPSNPAVVRIINEQIKSRDFWMPFAPVILSEKENEYLVNPKKISAPFMIIAFSTKEKGKRELKAALHPYDFSCRPQVLIKKQNPEYYQIIKEFEKITGIGALLNTSFNLHGYPIVCSPDDAIYVFANSGLKYLLLEDYLVSKK